LAFEMVKMNYGKDEAVRARKEFQRVFKKKKLPSKIKEVSIKKKNIELYELVFLSKLAPSKSEAKRLILQGGVRINNKAQKDWRKSINVRKGMIIQVGKRRFARTK
jgi:tyrosyl-tRNA synthetase